MLIKLSRYLLDNAQSFLELETDARGDRPYKEYFKARLEHYQQATKVATYTEAYELYGEFVRDEIERRLANGSLAYNATIDQIVETDIPDRDKYSEIIEELQNEEIRALMLMKHNTNTHNID